MEKTMLSLHAFLSFLPRGLSRVQIPPSPYPGGGGGGGEPSLRMQKGFPNAFIPTQISIQSRNPEVYFPHLESRIPNWTYWWPSLQTTFLLFFVVLFFQQLQRKRKGKLQDHLMYIVA